MGSAILFTHLRVWGGLDGLLRGLLLSLSLASVNENSIAFIKKKSIFSMIPISEIHLCLSNPPTVNANY